MGIKISIKSMGMSFYIPIIFNCLLIPLIVFFVARTGNEYNIAFAVNVLTQMFTPFFGSFIVCMHMSKYIDTKGNEIYFVLNKNKSHEIMKLFLVYIMTNTCWFSAYMLLDRSFGLEWLHIIIVTFLFVSATYCFCFLFRSVSLASIPSFLYTIYSVVGLKYLGKKFSYYEQTGMEAENLLSKYVYFIIVAIVLMSIGNALNDSYDKYNE